jgi:hypothetical protein
MGVNQFVVNNDIRKLYERIRTARVGDLITYEELRSISGFSVQSEQGRKKLDRARRRALKVDHLLFSAVPNVGIQCCNDVEVISAGGKMIRVVRSMARTGVRKLTALRDYGALDNEHKIEHNVVAAQLGMLEYAAGTRHTRQLKEAVRSTADKLSLGDTIDHLKKNTCPKCGYTLRGGKCTRGCTE